MKEEDICCSSETLPWAIVLLATSAFNTFADTVEQVIERCTQPLPTSEWTDMRSPSSAYVVGFVRTPDGKPVVGATVRGTAQYGEGGLFLFLPFFTKKASGAVVLDQPSPQWDIDNPCGSGGCYSKTYLTKTLANGSYRLQMKPGLFADAEVLSGHGKHATVLKTESSTPSDWCGGGSPTPIPAGRKFRVDLKLISTK